VLSLVVGRQSVCSIPSGLALHWQGAPQDIYGTVTCKAWLSHNTRAGAFGLHLPTALLYVTTAVRLLRWNYAGNMWYVVY
jgi:hypothetical protein